MQKMSVIFDMGNKCGKGYRKDLLWFDVKVFKKLITLKESKFFR